MAVHSQQKLLIVWLFSLLKIVSSNSVASDRDAVVINQGGILLEKL